jgi:hypothetical protein
MAGTKGHSLLGCDDRWRQICRQPKRLGVQSITFEMGGANPSAGTKLVIHELWRLGIWRAAAIGVQLEPLVFHYTDFITYCLLPA